VVDVAPLTLLPRSLAAGPQNRRVVSRRGHANPDVDDVPRVALDEVVVQRSYICGVSQLGQGVRLNLPDPLSGHPEDYSRGSIEM
jgi:hypothetical protein